MDEQIKKAGDILDDRYKLDCSKPVKTPAEIRSAGMDLLARREHGFDELIQKLERRFGRDLLLVISEQVQRLADENLQSDQRFAASKVRQRLQRLDGPIKIRGEMRQLGLEEHLIESSLVEMQPDWMENALELVDRKYSNKPLPSDWQEKQKENAKRLRFLAYRGYPGDIAQRAMRESE